MAGVKSVLPVETNIVIFDLEEHAPTALDLVERTKADGVLIGAFGERRVRVVTHLDVDAQGGDALCAALQRHLAP